MGFEGGMDKDALARENDVLRAESTQQKRLIAALTKQLATLLDEVAKLTKKPPDKRKKGRSEGKAPTTPESGEEGGEAPKPPARAQRDKPDPPAGAGPRRGPLPDHLERDVTPYPLDPNIVPCCSTPLLEQRDPIVQERKDYVPASVRVERIELHRAQCVCCGTMHTAPMPPVAMPNGSMTAALIAFIVHGKCGMHLPLVRLIEELATKGLAMAKTTMSNVMRHAAGLLVPVYDRIVAALFAGGLVHVDGTGVKALQPGEKGSHRGQFAVVCNGQLTAYLYSEDKSGKHLLNFFGVGEPDGDQGDLVADAANNMDRLYVDSRIRECGCWYHARAKFEEAAAGSPAEAAEAIAWIGCLFDVEEAADAAGDTDAERRTRRKRDSVRLLRGFYRWMRAVQKRFLPDEDLYKAVQYCLNHWGPLTRFMTTGAVPMTNNLAERELGVIGRGRKAWLFVGSDAGGEWLAVLYTVVRTCQRLSVAPFDYLAWVLPKLSDLPVNRGRGHLGSLTPMAYAEQQSA